MKMKNRFSAVVYLTSAALSLSLVTSANAAVIAVVDSGTDIKHVDLAKKIWNNPGETDDAVDNDNNGYVDDLHGWNFVDNNNKLVNRKQIGTFPAEVYKFFDFQTKYLRGTATPDEIAWMRAAVQDEKTLTALESFGNFIHGTHVAGISAKDADEAQIMGLKIIGTQTPIGKSFIEFERKADVVARERASDSSTVKEKILYAGLDYLASAQGKSMEVPGKYIASKKPQIANCSFGTSRAAVKPLIKALAEKLLGTTLTDEQANLYTDYFLKKTMEAMQKTFINPSPNTLFVIAAGNDGSNNDEVPAAPANVKTENTITVAATLDRARLASFSNYGANMVDIAAPGVGIRSTIPGDEYIEISGTSQATPYIANLAGRIMDANPKLTLGEVKLILMETVDHKDFLVNKVRSAGVANPDRALYAASLTKAHISISDAIQRSKKDIGDVVSLMGNTELNESELFVQPLPSFIK